MERSGLSGAQPLFVLVVGTPGSGKSFFARQFADSYRFFYVETGRFENIVSTLSSSNKEVIATAKLITDAILDQALRSFKHIILEGPYYSARDREEILSRARKAGFGTLIVWVQTDLETSEYRALNRDRRRVDDKYSLSFSQAEFAQMTRAFQKPNSNKDNLVVVSGKHDFKSQGVIVLKKIAGMYVNGATESVGVTNNSGTTPKRVVTRPVIR
ncbi:MAG: hypothetical protein QG623_106 [Patescibacteria group bacterium]|nr:hypothetical protein [Patescibacteria group bacterium]